MVEKLRCLVTNVQFFSSSEMPHQAGFILIPMASRRLLYPEHCIKAMQPMIRKEVVNICQFFLLHGLLFPGESTPSPSDFQITTGPHGRDKMQTQLDNDPQE